MAVSHPWPCPPKRHEVTKARGPSSRHLRLELSPRAAGSCPAGGSQAAEGPETDHVLLDRRLSRCRLSDPVCHDLSKALREAPTLTKLCLFHNGLSQGGLRVLSQGLAWPGCRVQTLR